MNNNFNINSCAWLFENFRWTNLTFRYFILEFYFNKWQKNKKKIIKHLSQISTHQINKFVIIDFSFDRLHTWLILNLNKNKNKKKQPTGHDTKRTLHDVH